jgi:cysteine sulfinate desulfinase/cysteine desulfurase-like protein/anaerobic selenocysteine-containing dehydrogenase
MNADAKERPETTWKRSLCGVCPAGCWVEVRLENDKIVDIREDQSHPLGMLCERGRHAPEIVHSPHRLRTPLKRKGAKGNFEFEPISWDDAYGIIRERLFAIRGESGPEAAAIYTGRGAFELSLCDIFQPKGVAVSSASSVLFPFGSPNTMGVGALCYVSFAMIAPHVTMGRMLVNMFHDIENTALAIVWGANPVTDSPPLDIARLEAAANRGAQVVVIDPRRSETVDRTGAEWIPIRPGTDGALALGLIEALIEDDNYDEEFATNWCHGFAELRRYTQHFKPEVVAPVTGVPAGTIRTLARRIREARGCAPIMYTGLEYSNSGIQAIRAVHTLWGLAGQLDVPGGLCFAMGGEHFPINRSCNLANPNIGRAVARDRFPLYSHYRGESHAMGLVDAVLKGEPYRIRALIVHGGSMLTSWPQTPIWRETLAALDFLVCIDRQMTADAAYADIVLPATTMFECQSYMVYGHLFRLRERVIPPVGEARPDYLIMAGLAKHLGYGGAFPQSEDEMLRFVLRDSGFTLEEVRANGGTAKVSDPKLMEYQKWRKGSLRGDGQPGFDTPTGRFEIHSTILGDFGYEPLPKYTEPREGPLAAPGLTQQYPLVFNSGARTQWDFRSQHHGVKGLARNHPEPLVEIHQNDAASRGIQSGDLVEVKTPRGATRFRALVTDTIMPGAIECNQGGGTPIGPKEWRDSNVNLLTDLHNYDEISGFPVYKALLCEVTRAQPGDQRAQARLRRTRQCNSAIAQSRSERTGGHDRMRVYLDHNSTTPIDPLVSAAMRDCEANHFGNPSSIHKPGRDASDELERARKRVASLIQCRPRRLIFTGGGSEANNLALKGPVWMRGSCRRHIVTTQIEHPSILETCRFLGRLGYRVSYLPPDERGWVDPAALADVVTNDTLLVSMMLANNEVGTILPIPELAAIARAHGALFHTDAIQAAGKVPLDLDALGVDMLSISAHKIHGPKGVGALFVRAGLALEPLVHGGAQEHGLRAGTENLVSIAGFGRAAELAKRHATEYHRIAPLRDMLEKAICQLVPGAVINGHPGCRLPNTSNIILPGVRGESLTIALDHQGVAISSGSACKTGSPEPTHVLMAMGRSAADAHCAIRISLGNTTTQEDIEYTRLALERVLKEMAETVRFLPCK